MYSSRLQHIRQVVDTEMSVRTSMRLTCAWRMFCQDLLTRVGRITSSSTVCVSSNISVGVPHVVAIFFVEGIIGDQLETLTPENQTILQRQANALQKERVLKTAVMFEVTVLTESVVKVSHAERKMLGKVVDVGSIDRRAG
jgi:hypothetical protein